jgi:hypothetical protein
MLLIWIMVDTLTPSLNRKRSCGNVSTQTPSVIRLIGTCFRGSRHHIRFCSSTKANAAQQILEPRVGAQRIEARPYEDRRVKSLSVGFI